jgi:hypothetical protein
MPASDQTVPKDTNYEDQNHQARKHNGQEKDWEQSVTQGGLRH